RQMPGVIEGERLGPLHKLENPFYYLGSIAWFALPGSAVLAVEGIRRRSLPWRPPPPPAAGGAPLSLMSRRAGPARFPAHPLVNLAGAQLLLERAQGLRSFIQSQGRLLEPALAALLIVAATLR